MYKDFSLIAACRGRHNLLDNFIKSVFSTPKKKHSIELLIVADKDDEKTHEIARKNRLNNNDITLIIKQERTKYLNRDYINHAVNLSLGNYLWALGNDLEIMTKNWDEILRNKIETFLVDKPDRISYIYIDDDIHKEGDYGGCCFPIVTREAVKTLGFLMPPELATWSADHYLWLLFKDFAPNRIMNCFDVKLNHYCYHNKRLERDDISRQVEANAINEMTHEKYNEYAYKLLRGIGK